MRNRLNVVWPDAPAGPLDPDLLWVAVTDLIRALPEIADRCQELEDPEGLHLSVMALGEVVKAVGIADKLAGEKL